MATFPALRPATRQYSMGQFPVTTEIGFGGGNIRFLHGTSSSGHTLELGFIYLQESEAKLIRDHYRGQNGSHVAFALSAEAWAGHTSMTDLVPVTTLWRYADAPQETHRDAGFMDVTVSLVSVI